MKKLFKIFILSFLFLSISSCTNDKPITIHFQTNGGNVIEDLIVNANDLDIENVIPIKNSYTFDGWYTDDTLIVSFSNDSKLDLNEITLYAKWLRNYRISFNTLGGSSISPLETPSNYLVSEPADPTKNGYSFDGWYTDQALSTAYVFTTMPAENVTLYAKWVINSYTMSFEENGGSSVDSITQVYMTSVSTPLAPIKDGYTFSGWYSDQTFTTSYIFTIMPAENMTLYAKWTVNQYTITFEENGGLPIEDMTQGYMTVVTAPIPIKEGNTFVGWFSDQSLIIPYIFSTMPIDGITLYAKWEINQYTITFEENGGSLVDDMTQNYLTPITAPNPPELNEFTFAGWFTNIALTEAFIWTTMPSSNMTLYAKWDPILYTITFINSVNGNAGATPLELALGQTINLPDPNFIEGYEFVAWYLDETLTIPYDLAIMPNHDFMIYGQWDKNTYTVTFETDGGTLFDSQDVIYTELVPNPGIPIKEGFIFAGWFYNEGLTFPYEFIDMPAENITLYVKWVTEGEFYPIDLLLINQPDSPIKVEGVVYYIFPDPLDGYYIYDGTGYLFVHDSALGLTVGDGIKVSTSFVVVNFMPQLINITEVTHDGAYLIMPSVTEMSLTYLVAISETNFDIYGRPVILTGIVGNGGTDYFLSTFGSSDHIVINDISYDMLTNPFETLVGQTITIKTIIYSHDDVLDQWHVLYDALAGITIVNTSD